MGHPIRTQIGLSGTDFSLWGSSSAWRSPKFGSGWMSSASIQIEAFRGYSVRNGTPQTEVCATAKRNQTAA